MSDEYGYRNRPPMKDRFVAGGVVAPKNQWPNRLLKEFRDPGDAGYTKTIVRAVDSSTLPLLAHTDAPYTVVLPAGGAATVNGWASEFGRNGYILDVTATGAATEKVRAGIPFNLSPRAFLDPDAPPFPGILRVEDVLAAKTTNAVASHQGGMSFGFTNENGAPPTGGVSPYPLIGFQSSWTNPDVAGEWNAVLLTAAPATIFSAATGFTSDVPHHFALELDGVAKQVNWYVDDTLVGAYAVEAQSDIYVSNANFTESIRWDTAALTLNTVVRSLSLCDMTALVTVTLYDLDTV